MQSQWHLAGCNIKDRSRLNQREIKANSKEVLTLKIRAFGAGGRGRKIKIRAGEVSDEMQRAPLSPLVSDCGIGGLGRPAIVEREIGSAGGAGRVGRDPRRRLRAVSAICHGRDERTSIEARNA